MRSNNIGLFEVFGDHRSSHRVPLDLAHVPHSVNLLDIQVVNLLKVLPYLRLRQVLLHLES